MTEEKRHEPMDMPLDVFSIFSAYLKPFVEIPYRLWEGYQEGQQEADRKADEFIAQLDANAEKADQKYRANRMDDLAYETGLLGYQKSALELEKSLKPSRKQKRRQPKITHLQSYKVYD